MDINTDERFEKYGEDRTEFPPLSLANSSLRSSVASTKKLPHHDTVTQEQSSIKKPADVSRDESSFESLLSVPLDFLLGPISNTTYSVATPDDDGCGSDDENENGNGGGERHVLVGGRKRVRQLVNQEHRPPVLLLKSEAWTLLRIRLVSSEMDVLMDMAADACVRLHQCEKYTSALAEQVSSPCAVKRKTTRCSEPLDGRLFLGDQWQTFIPREGSSRVLSMRAVLPLLSAHGKHLAAQKLRYVRAQFACCLDELKSLRDALLPFAEQNISVAGQLEDIMCTMGGGGHGFVAGNGNGHVLLARTKRWVGEVEEAVYGRIGNVLRMSMCCGGSGGDDSGYKGVEEDEDAFESARDPQSGKFVPMENLCWRLLQQADASEIQGEGQNDDHLEKGEGEANGKRRKVYDVIADRFADGKAGSGDSGAKNVIRSITADACGASGKVNTTYGSKKEPTPEEKRDIDSDNAHGLSALATGGPSSMPGKSTQIHAVTKNSGANEKMDRPTRLSPSFPVDNATQSHTDKATSTTGASNEKKVNMQVSDASTMLTPCSLPTASQCAADGLRSLMNAAATSRKQRYGCEDDHNDSKENRDSSKTQNSKNSNLKAELAARAEECRSPVLLQQGDEADVRSDKANGAQSTHIHASASQNNAAAILALFSSDHHPSTP